MNSLSATQKPRPLARSSSCASERNSFSELCLGRVVCCRSSLVVRSLKIKREDTPQLYLHPLQTSIVAEYTPYHILCSASRLDIEVDSDHRVLFRRVGRVVVARA